MGIVRVTPQTLKAVDVTAQTPVETICIPTELVIKLAAIRADTVPANTPLPALSTVLTAEHVDKLVTLGGHVYMLYEFPAKLLNVTNGLARLFPVTNPVIVCVGPACPVIQVF